MYYGTNSSNMLVQPPRRRQVDKSRTSEAPHRADEGGSGAGVDNSKSGETSLNSSQLEAVCHGQGPLIVVAGAGSGKTRTLTQRLVYLINQGVDPQKIIAITFTNKAAGEMRSRLPKSQLPKAKSREPFIGTFHSFGARILRKEARLLGRNRYFVIFDDDDSRKLIKKTIEELDLSSSKYLSPKVGYEISRLKNNLLDPEELDEGAKTVFYRYEERLQEQNAFDFDDLIEKVIRLFYDYPEILKKYQNQFEYILVDEYQDINTAQYVLVGLLSQGHRNLNVVGDDQQSIYGFRWSNFTNFLRFEKDWPEAKIVTLGENYRSTKNIVSASAAVIKNNKFQRPKDLWTSNESGKLLQVIGAEDPEEEAEVVIREIGSAPDSTDRAILYRTNAQSRALEQSLSLSGIPYEIFGGLKFYERKEIKDIMAGLRYALNPRDELSRERLEKNFRKRVAKELVEDLPRAAKELSLLELVGFVLKTTSYFEYLKAKFENAEERVENVNELVRFAGTFKALPDFIERVSLLEPMDPVYSVRSGRDTAPSQNKQVIKLMTIHLAKGLEFDTVYVVGASEGLLPHHRSLVSEAELEEERRLMYVAMTRARKNLTLGFHGLASRFLYEIPPELIDYSLAQNVFQAEKEIYLD